MDDEPQTIVHGAAGWRKGCKCFTCRRAHADDMKQYRKRRATAGGPLTGPDSPKVKLPPGAGTVEIRVRTQYAALNLDDSPEAQTLMDLAFLQAALIDSIPGNGKWHLLATAQKALLDLNDRLVKLGKPAAGKTGAEPLSGDEVEDLVASLGQQPRPS